jgi:hypothetical protein
MGDVVAASILLCDESTTTSSMEEDGFLILGVTAGGSVAAGVADDEEAGAEVRRSTNDAGVDVARPREVTPAEELTLEAFLCGKKGVSKDKPLNERKTLLCELVADGMPERLFSPEYLAANVAGISDLIESIRRHSKRTREWKKPTVVSQMVQLYQLLMADSTMEKQPAAASAFLKFMSDAATWVDDANKAARAASEIQPANPSNKRSSNTQPQVIPQASLSWDPSKQDNLPCPACSHWTVMNVEVEQAKPTKKQTAEYRVALADWNRLSKQDQANRTKPRIKGTILQKKVCMCCVMNCMNGSHSCPHCRDHPPLFRNGACPCEQCRCQCRVVFDAHSRFSVAQEAYNALNDQCEDEVDGT